MSKNESLVEALKRLNEHQKGFCHLADWLKPKVKGFSESSISDLLNEKKQNKTKTNKILEYTEQYIATLYGIETKPLSEISTPFTTPQDMPMKLKLYQDKDFYLYFYDESKNSRIISLGRAVVSVSKDNQATLHNIRGGVNTDYSGVVSLDAKQDYLIFNLKTGNTGEKDLHIRFRIGLGVITQYAIGGYIKTAETLELGSLILEYQEGRTKTTMQPLSIYPDTEAYHATPINIRKFFKKRINNYLKMMTKSIWTDDEFNTFFEQVKTFRRKQIIEKEDTTIFIAYQIKGLKNDSFLELMTLLRKMKLLFEETLKSPVYYQGINENYQDMNDLNSKPPEQVVFENSAIFDKANRFVWYYPSAVGRGTLIELGCALKEKSVVVFYKSEKDLPWNLKQYAKLSNWRINLVKFKNETDLLSKIQNEKPLFK